MKKYLPLALFIISIIFFGTSYNTIIIDGTNDFSSDEDVAGTGSSVYYFTWDANNLYLGADNNNVGLGTTDASTKFILFYIDTDPQLSPTSGTGTTTGEQYNTQQPGLPFSANYHFRWKVDGTFTNLRTWNGSSWVDGNQSNISWSRSGNFVEFKVPLSNLGSPTQIHLNATMINEKGGGEYTFYMTPNSQSEGEDADYTKWFGYDLITGESPDDVNKVDKALPVELVSFNASVKNKRVGLSWQTATELNNYGFEVERASSTTTPSQEEWQKIGFVAGNGNSNSPKHYSFVDDSPGYRLNSYRLKQIDNDGSYEFSKVVEVNLNIPRNFVLKQNYPNPFNPSTTIKFAFEKNTIAKLIVYDSLGNEIVELFNGNALAGRVYSVSFDASNSASGIYYYKLIADEVLSVKKMLLLK